MERLIPVNRWHAERLVIKVFTEIGVLKPVLGYLHVSKARGSLFTASAQGEQDLHDSKYSQVSFTIDDLSHARIKQSPICSFQHPAASTVNPSH